MCIRDRAEKRLYPECEVEPAGIFYYNVKDPMIQKTLQEDLDELDPEIMKKLKIDVYKRQQCL